MYGGSEGDALYGFCNDTVEGDGANDNVYGDSLGNEPGAADSLWGEDGDDEKYWGGADETSWTVARART
jgi:hypothetical protein